MSTINDSDLLLVERNGNLHQITYDQMSTLNDDDILLVERGGVQYKVEAQYISTGPNGLIVPPVEVLTPINGAGITEFDQYEPLSSAITTVGESGTIAKDTDEIISVATSSTGSVEFDGDDRLVVPSFTTAPQGTNDWTIEFYAYFDSWSGNRVVTWAAETSHPNYRIAVQVESGKYYLVDGGNYGGSWYSSKNDLASYTSVVAPLNKWHHVAVQRASGVDTIYVDGQVQFTASGHTGSSPSVTGNWIIGGGQSASTDLVGKLSNFRVLSGTALYSSTFTPPSTPLTNITNTVLLCCQSSSSATAAAVTPGTLTANGNPTAATEDVTGDKVLSFPTNTNFSGLSVGDVVQGNGLNGTASVTQGYTFTDGRGNLDNLFNGVVAGNGTASSDYLNHLVQPNDAGGLPCTLTFDPPLSARSGTLKAYVTRYSAGNVNYTINGSEGHSVYAASNPVEDDTGVTSISTFTFDSNTGNAQLWGFADGNGVLEHVDNVTVTTINASATPPTITVDGGTWDTSNQSQVWSDLVVGTLDTQYGNSNVAAPFDGSPGPDSSHGIRPAGNGNYLSMDFGTTFANATTLKIYGDTSLDGVTYTGTNENLEINGVPLTASEWADNGGSYGPSSATFTLNNGLTSLRWGYGSGSYSSGYIYILGIEVDGKLLVDAIEDSQVWSGDLTTPSNSFNGGQPATSAFDGDLSTFAGAGSIGEDMVFQPTTPVSYSDSVEVYISGHAGQIILNSNSPVATTDSPGWVTLVSGSSGSISSITIDPNSNRRATITAIRVDGKLLVDSGTRDLGETRISTSVSYEKSLTFTNTTELANMVAPLEMADATGSNSLTPTTSIVSSTTAIPSENLVHSENAFQYSGATTYNTGISGNRMVWFKNYGTGYGIISDSVNLDGQYIPTGGDTKSAQPNGITFNANSITDGGLMGANGSDHAFLFEIAETAEVFDIVSYTGDGSSSHVIPHNLGVEPGMIIIKKPNSNGMDWVVWHKDLDPGQGLALNLYNAQQYVGAKVIAVSSENFTVNAVAAANDAGADFIAYVFGADTAGKVKCGIYSGNNSDNTINVGFAPGFVLIKNIDVGYNWAASTAELMGWSTGGYWEPNQDNAASVSTSNRFMQTSSGFRITGGTGSLNMSGDDYIYLAIADSITTEPKTELTFQDNTDLSALTSGMTITSNLTPTLESTFSVDTYTGNSSTQTINNGIDLAGEGGLVWVKNRDEYSNNALYDTERGATHWLHSDSSNAEGDPNGTFMIYNSDGFSVGNNATLNYSGYDMVSWTFRKAPGFFDIQTWTGNGQAGRTIPHNLGTAPGMILVKRLNDTSNWHVYHKSLGATHPMVLNWYYAAEPITNRWNDTEPTSTEFTVGTWPANGDGYDYIGYIFADNPSNQIKCGSYTGTGADNNNIECGFEPAWVMIKNADESNGDKSDWYISDNQRGFSSSWGQHGKSLSANKADAEISDANIVVSATGFKPATSGAEYNKFGINYIYMAIGSPTSLTSIPTGTLVADADPSTNTAIVETTSWPTGDSVSGPSLSASLTSILEVSGNTIFGNGSNGSWVPGYYAEGSEINAAPPGPSEITFTSQNQGTPAFSGVDATLASRTWTLESGTTATGPWTVVDSYVDYDVLNSQDGSTPWTSNKPTLQPNTYYRIKVQYDSTNAESVESVYHTFKTGDA